MYFQQKKSTLRSRDLTAVMAAAHDCAWSTDFLAELSKVGHLSVDNSAENLPTDRRGDRALKQWISRELREGRTLQEVRDILAPSVLSFVNLGKTARQNLRTLESEQQSFLALSAAKVYTRVVDEARKAVSLSSPWITLEAVSIDKDIEWSSDLAACIADMDIFHRLQFRSPVSIRRDSEVRAMYCHADRAVQDTVLASLPDQGSAAAAELSSSHDWFEFVEDVGKWRRDVVRDHGRRTADHRPFLLLSKMSYLESQLYRRPPQIRQEIETANKFLPGKSALARISADFLQFALTACTVRVLEGCCLIWPAADCPPRGGALFKGAYEGTVLDALSLEVLDLGPVWIGAVERSRVPEAQCVPAKPSSLLETPLAPESFKVEPYINSFHDWLSLGSSLQTPLVLRFPPSPTFGRSEGMRRLRALLNARDDVSALPLPANVACDGTVEWAVVRIESPGSMAEQLTSRVLENESEWICDMRKQLVSAVTEAINPITNDHFEYLGDAVLDYIIADRATERAWTGDESCCEIGKEVSALSANMRLAELLPGNIRHFLINKCLATNPKKHADVVEAIAGAFYFVMRNLEQPMEAALTLVGRYAQLIGL